MTPNHEIEREAAEMYDPALPYHNFSHARDVMRVADDIVRACQDEGVAIDPQVVYYAALFHDAGYREDHHSLGFDSKEAYSAHLAAGVLRRHGLDAGLIERVEAAILCTHCDGSCRSAEDRAVRAADLSSLSADYEVFRSNSIQLKRELEMLSGKTVAWGAWKLQSEYRIGLFLREDVSLLRADRDADGNPLLQSRARANLARLMDDTELN
jgi:predicted metal-dependent HD superfamily phosphohydrolase